MNISRRHALTGAGAAALAATQARAFDYPTRPVRILIGYPSGTGPDLLGRIIAQWLSERLGQSFVVEARPGSGSNIATDAVIRSPADGYTLLLASGSNAWNATLYDNLPFNFIRDIAPMASIYQAPNVMVAHPSLPARNIPDLIAYAKANPGKLNLPSNGNGSTGHIYGGMFKMLTGVDMVHVPYRDNPIPDLLAGRTQVYFSPLSSATEYIKTGQLVALGVTSLQRWPALPDVPTVAEFVPGFEAIGWMGLAGPKGTPREIVDIINRAVNEGLADAAVRKRINDIGGAIFGGTPEDFSKFIADYTEKWAKVIRFAGIKVD